MSAVVIADVFGPLVDLPRWVCWQEQVRKGKPTKVPISPVTGRPTDATKPNPEGHVTYEEAVTFAERAGMDGVGIVLGDVPELGIRLGGFDLDACRNPRTGGIAPWAKEWIERFRTYTEVSPSGVGLKGLAFGAPETVPCNEVSMDTPPINGKAPEIAAYPSGRYFTITGQLLEGCPDEIRDAGEVGDAWDQLLGFLAKHASANGTGPNRKEVTPAGATEIPEELQAVLDGNTKAGRLWREGKDGGTDRSRNDAALAGTLGALGFEDRDVEAAIRAYPHGQVHQEAGTRGYDADRAVGRLLGIAAKAREQREPTLTDTGNASRLVRLHGGHLHYVAPWGRWLVEDDGFWTVDHKDVRVRELAKDVGLSLRDEAIREIARTTSKKEAAPAKERLNFALRSLEAKRIRDMVDLARGIHGIPLDHEDLDGDGWLLGVENGVVALRTGEHRAATAADLMTRRCPVRWEEAATAPRWAQALEEWFPDPEVRAYVQRVAGAALVGAQRDHVFVIHYGLGGNGKGTFTRALQHVLGPYALEVHLSLLVETKYKEHDTVKADLFRTRLAVAVETDRRVRLAEASVKNLTGGDRIRARRMREDPWSFDPTHSLWLQTNHLPEIAGRDEGIWRRIRVVKWVSSFTGKKVDRDLDGKLAAEAPGILRWLVEGCLSWQRHGLEEPEAVVRDTLAYRQKEDTFSRFQADTGLVFRPGLQIQAQELQDLLVEWAQEEGVDPPRQEVADWLRDQGVTKKQRRVMGSDGKTRRPKFWIGVGLEDGNHEDEQTDALA